MRRLRLARGGGAIMRLRTITPVERIGLLVRHPHALTLKAKIEEDAARCEGGQRKAASYPGAPRPRDMWAIAQAGNGALLLLAIVLLLRASARCCFMAARSLADGLPPDPGLTVRDSGPVR
jgi:hypothetical protein